MTTAIQTDTDIRVRDAVERQLDWDAEVEASGIGVAAHNGIVTLTGYIDTYAGKLAAERAVKRVNGIRGIVNDLEVRLLLERNDVDIAEDAVRALSLLSASTQGVQPIVHKGYVTLTGTVNWLYQKRHAEQSVRHIRGVRGVFDHIAVEAPASVRDVRHRIVRALHDSADVDARHIRVTVSGNGATLTGTVRTWLQRESAERAASNAPGMARVDNQIRVEPIDSIDESDTQC